MKGQQKVKKVNESQSQQMVKHTFSMKFPYIAFYIDFTSSVLVYPFFFEFCLELLVTVWPKRYP